MNTFNQAATNTHAKSMDDICVHQYANMNTNMTNEEMHATHT